MSTLELIRDAIIDGDKKGTVATVEQALTRKIDALNILNEANDSGDVGSWQALRKWRVFRAGNAGVCQMHEGRRQITAASAGADGYAAAGESGYRHRAG